MYAYSIHHKIQLSTGMEKNPDFETINDKGIFDEWIGTPANIAKDQNDAQSGKNYVKVWHDLEVRQVFEVKKGQKVMVKFYIRAIEEKK